MRFIFFGPPGSGKGTQAALLSNKFQIPHLSTGDILRAKLEDKDDLAAKLSEVMASGNLVSDEILNPIVSQKLLNETSQDGFILDGYPRNISQSDFLLNVLRDHKIEIDLIINFKVELQIVENRILERSKIEKRSDDNINVIQTRFKKYLSETEPLAMIYKKIFANKYFEIDASQEIVKIEGDIEKRLKNVQF
tara:strand:+ start:16215 stop:16793 length:579 start_codon:yes stop_codon:yes gene_type:complete